MTRRPTRSSSTLAPGVTYVLTETEDSLECRVAGPSLQPGSTVRALWVSGRVVLDEPGGSGSPDEQYAAGECARRLCKAARRTVVCSLSLASDAPAVEPGAAALFSAVAAHTVSACRQLDLDRLRGLVADPGGVHARLDDSATDALEDRVRAVLASPLAELERRLASRCAGGPSVDSSVLIFAPLYLSNACLNDCSYCGFRKSLRVERVKLDVPAALLEARCLADHGHRTLDLVAGEIPTDAFIAYVSEVCRTILRDSPIERIHLNLGALSSAQYAELLDAGATGYHLYQETYAPDVFFRVHGDGPKRDMANRLEGARRALAAGFGSIGLGVLLGLGPLERDLARLARHAHLLRAEFPGTGLGFSLPRIQAAGQEPGFVATSTIDDQTFKRAFLFLALEFPGAHLTLTTRERASLRDDLLPFGVTKLSAGVSTAPGGYSRSDSTSGQQFSIHDERTLAEVAHQVRAAGRRPIFH